MEFWIVHIYNNRNKSTYKCMDGWFNLRNLNENGIKGKWQISFKEDIAILEVFVDE